MLFDFGPFKNATDKERVIWGYLLSLCNKNQTEITKLFGLKYNKQIRRVGKILKKGKFIKIVTGEDSLGRETANIWKLELEISVKTLIANLKLRKEEVTFLRSFLDLSIPLLANSIEKIVTQDKRNLDKEQVSPLKYFIKSTKRNIYLLPFIPILASFERDLIYYGVDYTIGKDFDTKEAVQEWTNLFQKNDRHIRIIKALFKQWFNARPKGKDWRRVIRDRELLSIVYEDLLKDLSIEPAPELLTKFLGLEDGRFGIIVLTKQFMRPEARKKLRKEPKQISTEKFNEIQMMFLFYLLTEMPIEVREEIHSQWGKETIKRLAEITTDHLKDPRFRPTKWQKDRIDMLFKLEGVKRNKMKKD